MTSVERAGSGPSTWTPIVEGRVWEACTTVRGWPLRSVAVRLDRDGVVVVSPTRGLDAGDLARQAGPVRYLLAPNHYHHLGIPEWLAGCPGAVPVSTAIARPRLFRKHAVPWVDVDELAGAFAADSRLVVPEGTRNGEAWIEIDSGGERVWIVSDAFFNVTEVPGGLRGAFLRASQTAPGLRLGQTWKYAALADRGRYRGWVLDRLARAPPTALVPGHGDVVRDEGLAERLGAIVRERL